MPRARAQIDTAALAAAFAADGLHGTPIDRVVAAAGVAKPTLYARGGDKEELFALAVEAEVERLLERFEGGVGQIAAALDEYVTTPGARLLFVGARVGTAASVAAADLDRADRRRGGRAGRFGVAGRGLVRAARRPARRPRGPAPPGGHRRDAAGRHLDRVNLKVPRHL